MFNAEFKKDFLTQNERDNFVKSLSKYSLDEINFMLKEIEKPTFFSNNFWLYKWEMKTVQFVLGMIPPMLIYFGFIIPLMMKIPNVLLISPIFWANLLLMILVILGLAGAILLDISWLNQFKDELVKALKKAKIMKLEP